MVDAQLSINLFDGIVFGLLFMLAMLSMFRGFIREVLSFIGWVGAAFITLHSVKGVSNSILPHVDSPMVATIIGTMGTYFIALFGISLFSRLILRYVKEGTDVGAADNILGLIFGIFKGWIIIVLGFLVYSQVVGKEEYPDWLKTAYTLPAVEKSSAMVAGMMPSFLKDVMPSSEDIEEAKEDLDVGKKDLEEKIDKGKEVIKESISSDEDELKKLFDE